MKNHHSIFIITFLSLVFFSCVKKETKEEYKCLPEYIWINYAGERNHIPKFTLIRTCEQDTSYFVSAREDWDISYNDTTFFKSYCYNYIADTLLFSQLKKYILSHNTYKKEELVNCTNTAVKIVLVDQYDSIRYIVNAGDKGYFSNMIDSINPDKTLRRYLEYYQRMQERSTKFYPRERL